MNVSVKAILNNHQTIHINKCKDLVHTIPILFKMEHNNTDVCWCCNSAADTFEQQLAWLPYDKGLLWTNTQIKQCNPNLPRCKLVILNRNKPFSHQTSCCNAIALLYMLILDDRVPICHSNDLNKCKKEATITLQTCPSSKYTVVFPHYCLII